MGTQARTAPTTIIWRAPVRIANDAERDRVVSTVHHETDAVGSICLSLLVISRVCTSAVFMTYPACLSVLLTAWQMTATQAGIVQGAFTVGFALSLLAASFACDRFGATRVFNASTFASALFAIIFAVFARSFETAVVCLALVGFAQGGTYTPAIMVVAANTAPSTKASAVGWVLAGMSAGYVISISLSTTMIALVDYRAAFVATASVTVLGWCAGLIAVRAARDQQDEANEADVSLEPSVKLRASLLTLGYIGHSWELLGMWAWIPAFLAAAILSDGTLSAIELGLWTAIALHVSGFFSSLLSGYAADRFGAKTVLVLFALLGAVCSFSIGWITGIDVALLLIVTAIYGFATIGDSAVLSSAMTDAVPSSHLGRALGLRSILGIGSGALAPVTFGMVLDAASAETAWGLAFWTLGAGGLLALVCALALKR